MYYFDQAATSLIKPSVVGQAVYEALVTKPLGNPSRSNHEASIAAMRVVYQTRKAVKRLFHAPKGSQVVFTKNATEALNTAILGSFQPGDHIIATAFEHNSVLRPLAQLEIQGIQHSLLPLTGRGLVDSENLAAYWQENTRGMIVNHASNVTGNVVDLEKIAHFCREKDLLLIVDASQTAGIERIDMEQLGIDILCFTGHKSLYGPQGTGGMVVAQDCQLRPLMTGGTGTHTFEREMPEALPERLEAGTLNVHGLVGLLAGIQYVLDNWEKTQQGERLAQKFYQAIKEIPKITVYGDFSAPHVGVVSLNIAEYDSGAVSEILSEEFQMATRPGFHCAPEVHRYFSTETQGMVRFSFSAFNTEEEILKAAEALKKIASKGIVR